MIKDVTLCKDCKYAKPVRNYDGEVSTFTVICDRVSGIIEGGLQMLADSYCSMGEPRKEADE